MMDRSKKKRDLINTPSSSSRSTPVSRGQDVTQSRSAKQKSVTPSGPSTASLQPDLLNGHDGSGKDVVRGYDLRAHLAQIMQFGEDEDDDDYLFSSEDDESLESFDEKDDRDEELVRLAAEGPVEGQTRTPLPTGLNHCQSLVPITEDAEEEGIDSEEENEIMREIRNEITNNIRQEMKSELELYKHKLNKLEKEARGGSKEPGQESGETTSEGHKDSYPDLDPEMDPKLREAIIKMRKLDIILSKRVKKEKKVKRERILLERRIRRELEEIHREKPDEYKEVLNNEHKFLALELPARHNEENGTNSPITKDDFEYSKSADEPLSVLSPKPFCQTPATPRASPCLSEIVLDLRDITGDTSCSPEDGGVTVPDEFTGEEVFATALNEDDYPGLAGDKHKRRKGSRGSGRESGRGDSERAGSNDEDRQSRADTGSTMSGHTEDRRRRDRRKKKDFIKRNKELAADASNAIAMTEEEKKRLDDLLQDVDKIPEIAENMELDENNPFQLAVKPGDGFMPDDEERRTLTSIDSRLKELIPPEDYESIASSSLSHVPKHKLFTHTGVKHEATWGQHGERALFQAAEDRDAKDRLMAIEQELVRIKNPEEEELETPLLGEDQLQDLIDQCLTSLSRTSMSRMTLTSESRTSFADTESLVSHPVEGTVNSTPRSPRSARQDILDNPPRLAPEVLQKLLSEAYHPLSKQLTTLQEADNEDEDGTPIPSEVWKLISSETVDDSKISMDTDTLVSVSQSLADTDTSISQSLADSDMNNDAFSEFDKRVNNTTNKSGTDYVRVGKQKMPGPDTGEQFNHGHSSNFSARNGQRTTLSRNSSASSLASASDLGRDFREKEPLKLPEIDPKGSLIAQGFNGQRRSGSSNSVRTPVNQVRNSQSDSRMDNMGGADSRLELMSFDSEIMSPHPPSREKREGSGSKLRSSSRTSVS